MLKQGGFALREAKVKHPKTTTQHAQISKMLEDRRRSFTARVEGHASHVMLQRELRRKMLQSFRDAEDHHIHQNLSPMGENSDFISGLRRDILLAALRSK